MLVGYSVMLVGYSVMLVGYVGSLCWLVIRLCWLVMLVGCIGWWWWVGLLCWLVGGGLCWFVIDGVLGRTRYLFDGRGSFVCFFGLRTSAGALDNLCVAYRGVRVISRGIQRFPSRPAEGTLSK